MQMKDYSNLSSLPQGSSAEIYYIPPNCSLYTRFYDLGITEGAVIRCVRKKKGIAAFLIKGTVIALRDEDTKAIKTIPLRGAFDEAVKKKKH